MKAVPKIKAGALQFVLFIGAVIAVLLMAFVLLSYTHTHFDKKTDIIIDVIKSADFGLVASLSKPIPLNNSIHIPYQNDADIEIVVKRDLWGIFEKRTVTTVHGNTKYVKTALIGGKEQGKIPALYVNDHRRPVVVAGNSKITGTAYLPEQGLKIGDIYGNSYHRSRLLYGKQRQSNSVLPKLSTELKQQIQQLTQANYMPLGEEVAKFPDKVLKNSFDAPTQIIQGRVIRLKDIDLIGNIVIFATHKIIIEASANVQDVVLLAPEITIRNGVKGQFQAIASKSISVGKKCELAYPSALVVHKKKSLVQEGNLGSRPDGNSSPRIYLNSYAKISGVVMVLEETDEQQFSPQIKIDLNSKVIGEVYCTKNLELKGSVNGTVITDSFIALENGSVYQNHLYNGLINSTKLPNIYAGLMLADRERNKKVMKWLY